MAAGRELGRGGAAAAPPNLPHAKSVAQTRSLVLSGAQGRSAGARVAAASRSMDAVPMKADLCCPPCSFPHLPAPRGSSPLPSTHTNLRKQPARPRERQVVAPGAPAPRRPGSMPLSRPLVAGRAPAPARAALPARRRSRRKAPAPRQRLCSQRAHVVGALPCICSFYFRIPIA